MKSFVYFIGIIFLFVLSSLSFAKRLGPKIVNPLVYHGVRYEANHFEDKYIPRHGREIRIAAINVADGKIFWDRTIYTAIYNGRTEDDVQDIFITKLEIKDGKLWVTNEANDVYSVNLHNGKVLSKISKAK